MSSRTREARVALWGALILVPGASAQTTLSWTARLDGSGSGDDVATHVAVDDAGNVYVMGSSKGLGPGGLDGLDFLTAKYDAAGNELWSVRFDGSNGSFDEAYAIDVDSAGCVYVTGVSTSSGSGLDATTIKYDPDGNELWVQRYDGEAGSEDGAVDLVVDETDDEFGRVYVTGWSDGTGAGLFGWDMLTVAYSTDGVALWERRYDGPSSGGDRGNALALDDSGNLYVTGRSRGLGTSDDYTTIKYDAAGQLQWLARYDGPGSGIDNALDVAVDAAGGVYVTGYSDGTGAGPSGWDCATVRYDALGNELWAARFDGLGNDWDEGWQLALDDAGNVHVGGGSITSGNNWDYLTLKYDPAGAELWSRTYDGPASGFDEAFGIAVDGAGRVFVTGDSEGAFGHDDFATLAYDADGTRLWVSRFDGTGEDFDAAYAITADGAGNLVVVGESAGSGSDYLVALLPPEGLYADREQLSLSAGGQQTWTLGAGLEHAAQFYLVLGSAIGTAPAFPIGGEELPVAPDGYFVTMLQFPNSAVHVGSFGLLDASGGGQAALNLPPGTNPALAGTTLFHAFLTLDTTTFPGIPIVDSASNATSVALVP